MASRERDKDKMAEVGYCNKFLVPNLAAIVLDDGSKPEILSRIAQTTAALTKLKPIWRDNDVSLGSKVKLMRSRAGYRYPVFIENRLLTFDRYTEPNVCVSNKISIHSLRRVK